MSDVIGEDSGSGKVAIWNMAPVKEEKDEKDENVPKILCQMDNHLGNYGVLKTCLKYIVSLSNLPLERLIWCSHVIC